MVWCPISIWVYHIRMAQVIYTICVWDALYLYGAKYTSLQDHKSVGMAHEKTSPKTSLTFR